MPDGPCALTVSTLLIAAATPDQIRAIRDAVRTERTAS